MGKLYIVGDSFASNEDTQFIDNSWVTLLGNKLGVEEICNRGMMGSSQDFAFYSLQDWEEIITPDDYIVVALTHAARFWFFEDYPAITKPDHLEHFKNKIGPYRHSAASLYLQYIQRPELDSLHIENRIAWLSYTAEFRGWKKPLVINAIANQGDPLRFEYNLNFSKGDLTTVSFAEVRPGATYEEYIKIIERVDPRYNHLCLSNHAILADKIYNTLVNDIELDLTTGFKENILSTDKINDLEFQKQELSPYAMQRRSEHLQNAKKEYNAWRLKSMFKF
jgi:hypothetical protein